MDAELKAYLEEMRKDLTHQIIESRVHSERLNQETRQDMERLNQETRLLIEGVRDDVRGVADGVIQVNGRLDRLEQSVTEQFQQHDKRLMRLESARRNP